MANGEAEWCVGRFLRNHTDTASFPVWATEGWGTRAVGSVFRQTSYSAAFRLHYACSHRRRPRPSIYIIAATLTLCVKERRRVGTVCICRGGKRREIPVSRRLLLVVSYYSPAKFTKSTKNRMQWKSNSAKQYGLRFSHKNSEYQVHRTRHRSRCREKSNGERMLYDVRHSANDRTMTTFYYKFGVLRIITDEHYLRHRSWVKLTK